VVRGKERGHSSRWPSGRHAWCHWRKVPPTTRERSGCAAASGEQKFNLSEGIARFGDILKQGGARRCRAVASGEGSAHDLTPLGWQTAGEQWPVNLEEVACGEWWSVAQAQWPVVSGQ